MEEFKWQHRNNALEFCFFKVLEGYSLDNAIIFMSYEKKYCINFKNISKNQLNKFKFDLLRKMRG